MTDRGLLATLLSPVYGRTDRSDPVARENQDGENRSENVVVDSTETMDVGTAPAVDDELVFVASDVSGSRPHSESGPATPPADD